MSNLSDGDRNVLVNAQELHALLAREPVPVVLDVRWKLGETDGRRQYEHGHLPGAVYVDLETELSSPPSPHEGRHPLPGLESLQTAARRWGVRTDSLVVAYDDNGNMAAARAWWLLRWAGFASVALLDGALAAWREAGHALERGPVTPQPGDVELTPGRLETLDADDAARLARDGVLLDARAAERFRGEVEPVDPRPGHVPGARSAPTAANLRANGTFKDPDELLARFRALGVDGSAEVGVYCGSGVTAAHEIAALTIAGLRAALYPGSWSQWSADPSRPAALGE